MVQISATKAITDRVKWSVSDGVAEVLLNRPDKMNALDLAMFEAIIATAEALRQRADVRAIVLAGAGPVFCAGLDISLFTDGNSVTDLLPRSHGIANLFQQAAWVWHELPVPVIAAVQGVAFGGGLQIMMGADIRYVAPPTQFSIMEIDWGLVPDMAGTQLCKHLVRADILRELTYTGRRFGAEEAVSFGFATRMIDEPLAAALTLAREIANNSPDAVRAAKRLYNEAPMLNAAEGLLLESVLQQELLGSRNQTEALLAKRDKREPRFINSDD